MSRNKTPNLRELQRWLGGKISGAVVESPGRDCSAWIRRAPPLSPSKRLGIYAEAFELRLLEALSKDYSLVREALGEGAFRSVILEYLSTRRRGSWSLSHVGKGLSAFLRRHKLSSKHPELADLAQLDFLKVQSFFAADAEPWDSDTLRELSPRQWSRLRLKLSPSVFFARYRKTLVYREVAGAGKYQVQTMELSRVQWNFLRRIERGDALGHCLEAIRDANAPVGQWLKTWAECGVLART